MEEESDEEEIQRDLRSHLTAAHTYTSMVLLSSLTRIHWFRELTR